MTIISVAVITPILLIWLFWYMPPAAKTLLKAKMKKGMGLFIISGEAKTRLVLAKALGKGIFQTGRFQWLILPDPKIMKQGNPGNTDDEMQDEAVRQLQQKISFFEGVNTGVWFAYEGFGAALNPLATAVMDGNTEKTQLALENADNPKVLNLFDPRTVRNISSKRLTNAQIQYTCKKWYDFGRASIEEKGSKIIWIMVGLMIVMVVVVLFASGAIKL